MAVCACLVVTNHSVSKSARLGVPLNISLYHSTGKRSAGAFPNLPHFPRRAGVNTDRRYTDTRKPLWEHFTCEPKDLRFFGVQVTAYDGFSVVALPI